MSIDNQASILTPSSIGTDVQTQLLGKEVVAEDAEDFLQHLTGLLDELDKDSLKTELQGLDGLTLVPEEADLNPTVGRFLPPVAIYDPKTPSVEDLSDSIQHTPLVAGLVEGKIVHPNPAKVNSTEPAILPSGLERVTPKLETSGDLGPVNNLSIEVDSAEVTDAVSKQALNSVNAFVPNAQSTRKTAVALERPVGQPGWNQELGNRIIWMTGKLVDVAEIRLNPPQLGPLEVRVNVNQDQASVTFTAQNSVVREAIEAAVPRLREMFSSQQLNLGNVDVSQHSFSEHHRHESSGESRDAEHRDRTPHLQSADELSVDIVEGDINLVARGLVSYYV